MTLRFDVPVLSEAEARLEHDFIVGFMDYPGDLEPRDQYFRHGIRLLQKKLRTVAASYMHFATDLVLRQELEPGCGVVSECPRHQ